MNKVLSDSINFQAYCKCHLIRPGVKTLFFPRDKNMIYHRTLRQYSSTPRARVLRNIRYIINKWTVFWSRRLCCRKFLVADNWATFPFIFRTQRGMSGMSKHMIYWEPLHNINNIPIIGVVRGDKGARALQIGRIFFLALNYLNQISGTVLWNNTRYNLQ